MILKFRCIQKGVTHTQGYTFLYADMQNTYLFHEQQLWVLLSVGCDSIQCPKLDHTNTGAHFAIE